MGALLVLADVDEVVLNHLKDSNSLLDRTVGQKSLEEVVSILILHDFGHVLIHLLQKELNQVGRRLLKHALKLAGPCLSSHKPRHVIPQDLKAQLLLLRALGNSIEFGHYDLEELIVAAAGLCGGACALSALALRLPRYAGDLRVAVTLAG